MPDWVKVKPISKEEENAQMFSLGKRERKELINYDNLSEQQFLKIIEEGKDPNEVLRQAALRRDRRRQDGTGEEPSRSNAHFDDDELDGDSNDAYESGDDFKKIGSVSAGPNSTKRRKRELEDSQRKKIEVRPIQAAPSAPNIEDLAKGAAIDIGKDHSES